MNLANFSLIRILLLLGFASFSGIGALFLYRGIQRQVDLIGFYNANPLREFSDIVASEFVPWWQKNRYLSALINRVGSLNRTPYANKIMKKLNNQIELANLPLTAGAWLVTTINYVIIFLIAGVLLSLLFHEMILLLLPIMIFFLRFTKITRTARQRKESMQRDLPVVLALMGSASDILNNLDGPDGVMAWTVKTVKGDVINLFRDLIIKSNAQKELLEDVFEIYAEKFQMMELATMGQIFRIYHSQGQGLSVSFKETAAQWTEEQANVLGKKMRRRGFTVQVLVLILYVPTILGLLLAPAIFHVASALGGGAIAIG